LHKVVERSGGELMLTGRTPHHGQILNLNHTEDIMHIPNCTISGRIRNRGIALYFYLIPAWLFILTLTMNGQTASVRPVSATSTYQFPQVTMNGTVQQLTTAKTAGTQAGGQLMVDGLHGTFIANLGPSISRGLQQSLSSGKPVQISGTMQTTGGQEYLVAYVLTVDGNQIIIRNKNGFLAHTPSRARNTSTSGALYGGTK
jgi:hypothetical protein